MSDAKLQDVIALINENPQRALIASSGPIPVEVQTIHPLAAIERRASELTTDAGVEAFLELDDAISAYLERLKELREIVRAVGLEHCLANGPITTGDIMRFAASDEKTTKLRARNARGQQDPRPALQALYDFAMQHLGGDWDAFAAFFSADCLKPSAVQKATSQAGMPEIWGQLFEVIRKPILVEGKPAKKLIAINTAFTK